jgi:hypothetical protein
MNDHCLRHLCPHAHAIFVPRSLFLTVLPASSAFSHVKAFACRGVRSCGDHIDTETRWKGKGVGMMITIGGIRQ